MQTLEQLSEIESPTIPLIRQWIEDAENDCEILPSSGDRDRVLLATQVTTHSTMGALAYETGGILIDSGWLRFLGSGHPKLPRDLADWNECRSHGFYLVADDAVGGFFAVNDGAFGEQRNVYYWAPDSLEWESLGFGFTDFFQWALTSLLADFYQNLRWPTWLKDVAELPGDRCFNFCPFLWAEEGSVTRSDRRQVPVGEAFDLKVDIVRQLSEEDR
jgi:hypothetical protein